MAGFVVATGIRRHSSRRSSRTCTHTYVCSNSYPRRLLRLGPWSAWLALDKYATGPVLPTESLFLVTRGMGCGRDVPPR